MSHITDPQPPCSRNRVTSPLESPPGKRARTATNSTDSALAPYTKRFTPNLLSLPDGPISLIFSFLNASDTTGLLNRPRHAFALAITNTRLLRIFATHLTRIVPDLNVGKDLFHTLTRGHMLSVIRIAGPALRELNLPLSCRSLVKRLPQFCPRLEKIHIEDLDTEGLSEIVDIFLLPLRSLSIECASSRTLRMLCKTPEELSLIHVEASNDVLNALKALLRNLPRKLHLHFLTENALDNRFLAYLREICPGLEEFSLKSPYEPEDEDEDADISPLITRLVKLLRKRRGTVHSKCRKMTLEGDVFEFLECAHTEAHVEITRQGQTFIDSGNGIYPTRITLRDEYLDQDLSRLTDIVIRDDIHLDPTWANRISGIGLKHVQVEGLFTSDIWHMDIQADVIEVSSKFLTDVCLDTFAGYCPPSFTGDVYKDIVQWLCGANEVRIFDEWDLRNSRVFFASLARLIDQFPGKVIFLNPRSLSTYISFTNDFEDINCIFGALVVFMRCAVDNFEARGGDASTVRSLINAIYEIIQY